VLNGSSPGAGRSGAVFTLRSPLGLDDHPRKSLRCAYSLATYG